MKLGKQVGLGPGHFVLDGDPASLSKRGRSPQLSADICCGKMAGCINMALGRKAGLVPSDVVLDGDSAPTPPKGGGAPP